MVTTTNKRLLISESRCTPHRKKPDQHTTRFPRSVHVGPSTIRISCGPHIVTLREVINSDGQSHCSWEKGLPTQSTTQQLTDPWVRTQFPSQASQWSNGGKATLYWWLTTRLTGPITLACNQYVQYLLMGANPSVLNRHTWELQPWRRRLSTYHSLTFPNNGLPFPLEGPTWSLV
jgi:hypothetical protein